RLLRLDDLAALGLAVGRRRLHVALALARVLTRARVAAAGAAALALARVDAGAHHLIAAGLLLGARVQRAAEEERRRGARGENSLARLVHARISSSSWSEWLPVGRHVAPGVTRELRRSSSRPRRCSRSSATRSRWAHRPAYGRRRAPRWSAARGPRAAARASG